VTNGLSSTVGLMTTSAGRDTVKYLVRCALPTGQSLVKKDQNGVSYTFPGQIGVAPQWADGECNIDCQESVSACMLAHVNTTGQNIPLWLDGNVPGVGWGQSTGHPYEEGSFFGNIFVDPPQAYYCNGKDFDQGVVPGRLGANQVNAPYKAPGGVDPACAKTCTAQDIPNDKDGYKACYGFNHVLTVWRNFDANTNYKICNRASGKCLDNTASTLEGGAVVQKSYTKASSQKWKIVQVSPKQYKVLSVASGKALAVAGKLTLDKTPVVQTSFVGSTAQLWSFTSMANSTGYHAISPVFNTKSVVAASSTSEGAAVQQLTWSASATTMQWTISLAE